MGDLISRKSTIDSIRECAEAAHSNHEWDMEQGYLNAIECIEEEPSAEPKHGKWIPCTKTGVIASELVLAQGGKWYGFKCSECRYIYKGNALTESIYCQCCGARMDG